MCITTITKTYEPALPVPFICYKAFHLTQSNKLKGIYNSEYYEMKKTYKAKELHSDETYGMARKGNYFGFHAFLKENAALEWAKLHSRPYKAFVIVKCEMNQIIVEGTERIKYVYRILSNHNSIVEESLYEKDEVVLAAKEIKLIEITITQKFTERKKKWNQ